MPIGVQCRKLVRGECLRLLTQRRVEERVVNLPALRRVLELRHLPHARAQRALVERAAPVGKHQPEELNGNHDDKTLVLLLGLCEVLLEAFLLLLQAPDLVGRHLGHLVEVRVRNEQAAPHALEVLDLRVTLCEPLLQLRLSLLGSNVRLHGLLLEHLEFGLELPRDLDHEPVVELLDLVPLPLRLLGRLEGLLLGSLGLFRLLLQLSRPPLELLNVPHKLLLDPVQLRDAIRALAHLVLSVFKHRLCVGEPPTQLRILALEYLKLFLVRLGEVRDLVLHALLLLLAQPLRRLRLQPVDRLVRVVSLQNRITLPLLRIPQLLL
mmetsp:Transcript_47393/g.115407  ORF Transcript_47393/g.115407 Transcript_47393/m.115407 type:complete len:323 (-) Transcript_47393:47-1015(-)